MWFWNRREIYCGYSMKDFSDIRDKLVNNGIRYDYRLFNPNSNNRSRFGSFGQSSKYDIQYYIYVHKKNYDEAMYLLSKNIF